MIHSRLLLSPGVRRLGVLLLVTAAGAALAAPDEDSDSRARERKHDPEKRVCHKVTVTGSHLPQRVCSKQKEWDRLRDEAQRTMQDMRPNFNGGEEAPR